MIERRTFLKSASAPLFGAAGLPSRIFAETMHPFSPERVMVLDRPPRGNPAERRVWRQLRDEGALEPHIFSPHHEACAHIVHVVLRLSERYGTAASGADWAGLASLRYMMGSDYFIQGFGTVLSVQSWHPDEPAVRVDTPPMDWWLILIRQGFATRCAGHGPGRTNVLFTHVCARPTLKLYIQRGMTSQYILEVLLQSYGDGMRSLSAQVAGMNPEDACRFMNRSAAEAARWRRNEELKHQHRSTE